MDVYGKEIDMETATKEVKKLLSIAQDDDEIIVDGFVKPYWSDECIESLEGISANKDGLKSDIKRGTLIRTLLLKRDLDDIKVSIYVDENGFDYAWSKCNADYKCFVCNEYDNKCPIWQYKKIRK
ncbi:hypothetical protein HN777_04910 [Candidatus Woesearchaeota archaeon]|jgi:hypothetical protein|nr:hypothetical protein [Candidatus Woesearchaeota archaeon]MBT7403101.1 hypothetical protein [Candidatus Woesearchaeota archaeon]